jgi:hypothetical protein
MRTTLLALSCVLLIICGCQSGQRIETRTHTVAPWQVSQIPTWERTIETTVAPEKWNEEGSPHRISATGSQLTIRTTKSNQDAILKYLSTVVTAR